MPNLATRTLAVLGRGLERIGRRVASIDPTHYLGSGGLSPVLSGVVVTPQSALTLTAFYSGVNVISTDVAKLPFGLYRTLRGGGIKLASKDPRHRLLRVRPNPEMNAMRYWQAVMGHALGWGGHFSEIVRDGDGMPRELWPLHPGTTKPFRDKTTKALYYQDINTGKRWLPENILHIAGLGFDGISGYSPATQGRQAIGLGIGAERFGASLFGNGAVPNGILKTAKTLSETAVKRLRESINIVHRGSENANQFLVLEEGLEWIQTQISPEAAQFLLTRQFQVLEIARLLNLPPHKVGDWSQAHLAGVEEGNLDYATNTLTGWLEAIEAECNHKLLFEDELDRLFCQHDMSALLRGNMAARASYFKELKLIGVVNADTVAAAEGLPIPGPDNGGNLYTIQSQNIPAQNAGKPQPKPAPAPKTPSVKPDDEPAPETKPDAETDPAEPGSEDEQP